VQIAGCRHARSFICRQPETRRCCHRCPHSRVALAAVRRHWPTDAIAERSHHDLAEACIASAPRSRCFRSSPSARLSSARSRQIACFSRLAPSQLLRNGRYHRIPPRAPQGRCRRQGRGRRRRRDAARQADGQEEVPVHCPRRLRLLQRRLRLGHARPDLLPRARRVQQGERLPRPNRCARPGLLPPHPLGEQRALLPGVLPRPRHPPDPARLPAQSAEAGRRQAQGQWLWRHGRRRVRVLPVPRAADTRWAREEQQRHRDLPAREPRQRPAQPDRGHVRLQHHAHRPQPGLLLRHLRRLREVRLRHRGLAHRVGPGRVRGCNTPPLRYAVAC
jgi:hypothetical protein